MVDRWLKKYHYSIDEDFIPYALRNMRDQVPRALKVRPPALRGRVSSEDFIQTPACLVGYCTGVVVSFGRGGGGGGSPPLLMVFSGESRRICVRK